MEVGSTFSSNEMELLKQVRHEMSLYAKDSIDEELCWGNCPVATTILFNLAVVANENASLKLTRRGYVTISKNIASADATLSTKSTKSSSPLFAFVRPRVVDDEHSSHERAIQSDLYDVLKASHPVRHRKRVFVKLYWLAACVLQHVNGKSFSTLSTRWDTLGKASKRHKAKQFIGAELDSDSDSPSETTSTPLLNGTRFGEFMELCVDAGIDASFGETIVNNADANSDEERVTDANSDEEKANSEEEKAPIPINVAVDVDDNQFILRGGTNQLITLKGTPTTMAAPATQRPQVSELIREDDLDKLAAVSETYGPHRKGKWIHIFDLFQQMYPTSTITLNALRIRVNRRNSINTTMASSTPLPLVQQPSPTPNPSTNAPYPSSKPPTNTAKRTGRCCPSCVKRRRGCGPYSKNLLCANRISHEESTANSPSITRYFPTTTSKEL